MCELEGTCELSGTKDPKLASKLIIKVLKTEHSFPSISVGNYKRDSSWLLARLSSRIHRTCMGADPLNLRPQPSRLEIRKHFFFQRVVAGWNSIPVNLKQAVRVKRFKTGSWTFREKNGGAHLKWTRTEEYRKAVWPTTITGQSLGGSTGTMKTHLPSIQVS